MGTIAGEIKDRQVATDFLNAVNTGVSEMDVSLADMAYQFRKQDNDAADSAAYMMRFLQRLENENENSKSGVSDSGSGGGVAPVARDQLVHAISCCSRQ